MTVNVRHSLNLGVLRAMVQPGRPIARDMRIRGLKVQTAAKRRLSQSPRRIDTGNLINSIQIREYTKNGVPIVRIGTDVSYGPYVFLGTRRMAPNPALQDGLKAARTS